MTRHPIGATRPSRLLLAFAVVGLAACNSAATPTPPPASAAAPSVAVTAPSASPTASAPVAATDSAAPVESAGSTAVPTSLDPCQLVPASEVSALLGTTFTKGHLSTENNVKICAYSQQGIVFEVVVAVAPDAATAKAKEPGFKAQLESGISKAGIVNPTLTELPNFEPGVDAAVVSGSASAGGITVKAIALYALKGAVFVAMSDVAIGGSVVTSDALQAQARTTLARLP